MLKRILIGSGVAVAVGLVASVALNSNVNTDVIVGQTSNNRSSIQVVVNQNNKPTNSAGTLIVKQLTPKAEQLIVFNTPVVYETVEATIERLELLKTKGYKEAFLILDSPGGSVFDGARLVAWMKDSPLQVHTICDGVCASMAAHLFESGRTRYMTGKSTLMFHPASGGVQGTLEQMGSRLNYVKTFVDRLDANVAERAGIDYNEFKNRTLVEYWVETEDAVSNGLADNMAFISYARNTSATLNMEERMRQLKKEIPQNLKQIGINHLDTIRLNDVEAK